MRSRVVCRGTAAKRLALEMGVRDAVAAVRLRGSALIEGLPGPPFVLDVPAVLSAAKVAEVRDVANSSLDGRIFRQGAGFVIELNGKLPPARRAFTLAHEIAHTFFLSADAEGARTDGVTGRFDERNEEEYLCDVAAAEMLMPACASIPGSAFPALGEWHNAKNAFLKRVVESAPSVDSVLALARDFGTSVTATARRFSELTRDDIYIGFWRTTPRNEIEFEFGFASNSVDLRVPRGFVVPGEAMFEEERPETGDALAPADLGLMNSAGERVGAVLTRAQSLRSTGRIISVSLLNETAKRVNYALPRRAADPESAGQRKLAF